MPDNLYCALASNSVSFGANGHQRPCCALNTNLWDFSHYMKPDASDFVEWFNNDNVVDVREKLLNNEWHPTCTLCKIREASGQPSQRTIFNHTLNALETSTGRDWHDSRTRIDTFENIFLLDVTVGNKCNSACLMCNPSASDVWQAEQEELRGEKIEWDHLFNWFNAENAVELVDRLPNLRAIQFVGGEPSINKDHIVMLEELVRRGMSKNITLGYVTNLTSISEHLIDLWNHFSTKHITVSIDGVNKTNEYIRFPFSWDKVLRGLERIKKQANSHGDYSIGLSHTVTPLNILKLDETLDWWEDQIDSNNYFLKSIPHIQCVNNPSKFDPVYMPDEMKEELKHTLLNLQQLMQSRGLAGKYDSVIDNLTENIINSQPQAVAQYSNWSAMLAYCKALDNHRKRKMFDYLPFMEKYIQREYNNLIPVVRDIPI